MDFIGIIAHWFASGGLVMYALLLCSILSLSIIIERFRYYRSKNVKLKQYMENLHDDMRKYSVHELYVKYRASTTAAGVVTAAGFRAVMRGRHPERAMESAAQLEAAKLKKA